MPSSGVKFMQIMSKTVYMMSKTCYNTTIDRKETNVVEFPYGEIRNPLIDPKEHKKDADVIEIEKHRELENDNP